jgi:hypothetical protein
VAINALQRYNRSEFFAGLHYFLGGIL